MGATNGAKKNMKQSSFFQVLSFPLVYACLAPSFINGLVAYMLEPLYETVLTPAPYCLSVSTIGFFSSILALGWSAGFFLIGAWAIIYCGDLLSQNIGMAVRCISLLFLGPLWGLPASAGLFATMAFLCGLGATLGGPATTTLALRVLDVPAADALEPEFTLSAITTHTSCHRALVPDLTPTLPHTHVTLLASQHLGMPKSKVGGALSSVLLFLQYSGAFIGPLIGGPLNEAWGFSGVTFSVAVALVIIYVPCSIALRPYAETGKLCKVAPPAEPAAAKAEPAASKA